MKQTSKSLMLALGMSMILTDGLSFRNTSNLGHYRGGSYKARAGSDPTNIYNGKHTKKQLKARAKSKRSKQSRKLNKRWKKK